MAHPVAGQLLHALSKVDRPVSFCASGSLPTVLPGLEVDPVGPIGLPLVEQQAEALRQQARQAPYGKGERTLVDTSVRRVWEIDAAQVTLTNAQWPDVLAQAVGAAADELGLAGQRLQSHLYKLLLYEPGSFFRPHRDGEKLERMVATLVIALPSVHEGGELIVRHEGREQRVDFGGAANRFRIHFAAFYADCEHEIRPVRSGYRLCLIYNLTLAKAKKSSQSNKPVGAPISGGHINTVSRLLSEWAIAEVADRAPEEVTEEPTEEAPQKLVVTLGHQYTQAGLTFDALKGVDRAKAHVLFEAARQADCKAYLALLTLWQSGSAESSGGYGGYGGYDRYGSYEGDGGDYEMGELFDWSLSADHWSDEQGRPLPFGQLPIDETEVVSDEPLQDAEPDREDFEGYTGNAGMTLDRWYHRAAVVIWPAARHFDVLCEAGVESAVAGLAQMVEQWAGAKRRQQPSLRAECLEFAARIIARWPQREYVFGYIYEGRGEDGTPMLPLLDKLGEVSLIAAWLRGVPAKDASVDPGRSLGDVCQRHGWLTFQHELDDLFQQTTRETIERNIRLLADLALRRDRSAERRQLCRQLAERMLSVLVQWDTQPDASDRRAARVDRAKLLPPLVQSIVAAQRPELLMQLVEHVLGLPTKYELTSVQMPALLSLRPWLARNVKEPCNALERWLTACRDVLKTRAANPPQEPSDWRRESKVSCKCPHCQELSRFLDDPTAELHRIPLRKELRRHLHQIIDQHALDLEHVTERRGRPYTLVCTKTTASYQRALKARRVDLEHLKSLELMLDRHGRAKSGDPASP